MTAALRKLTPLQRRIVAAELASLDAQPASTVIVEGRFAAKVVCPHCKAERVSRHGHANGLQRYRCRDCGKTFSALTGTPLCGLHKRGKWLAQAEALREGLTLHKVADALHIHVSTAHRRRQVSASMAHGTCRTSMRTTAVSKVGATSFAAWRPVTWRTTWAGSARSNANMATAQVPLSGSLWPLAERLNNMICEKSHFKSPLNRNKLGAAF